jgi:chromosome segregation ATPase
MQSSLNTLTATAGQTALDVLAMTARQEAVRAALQSHNETTGTQIARLADTQQQMQSGLDTITAITGQASLDTLAMSNRQGELGQAVQAGRQEMAGKLAVMAQDQQNWSSRLDAAQAKVGTIAGSIAALEQQITKLQEALQTGLQGTTATLGATSQQRQQFEAKVGQDIQTVIDSLAQLRQTQTSLQEQLTQVQKSTQGQADSIRSVIEQIKTTPNMDGRVTERLTNVQDRVGASESKQPPAEVRISAAAEKPQTPVVAESAK